MNYETKHDDAILTIVRFSTVNWTNDCIISKHCLVKVSCQFLHCAYLVKTIACVTKRCLHNSTLQVVYNNNHNQQSITYISSTFTSNSLKESSTIGTYFVWSKVRSINYKIFKFHNIKKTFILPSRLVEFSKVITKCSMIRNLL